MRLIIGLGNPGAEYAKTRHNAGFWLLDAVARQHNATLAMNRNFNGIAGKFSFSPPSQASQDIHLLQPQTYMNRSGQSVAALMRFYKLEPADILVVHDELDLPAGAARLKRGGGTGGHNGLKDIQAHLGTADYWRLRLGIGHPRELGLNQQVADFVLHKPSLDHQIAIDLAIDRSLAVLPQCLAGRMNDAMSVLHTQS